jgi:3-phenylpropionate/trans-cinnamate dioxygenase ferredoxin subunit
VTWIRACSIDELDAGDAVQLDVEPPIAVFNVDGEYFALDDTCTHDKSSLADGYVEGGQVECSWHFAKFCIRTGSALTRPATVAVGTYDVRVDGDQVLVDVDR